jgi:hypothetical protein
LSVSCSAARRSSIEPSAAVSLNLQPQEQAGGAEERTASSHSSHLPATCADTDKHKYHIFRRMVLPIIAHRTSRTLAIRGSFRPFGLGLRRRTIIRRNVVHTHCSSSLSHIAQCTPLQAGAGARRCCVGVRGNVAPAHHTSEMRLRCPDRAHQSARVTCAFTDPGGRRPGRHTAPGTPRSGSRTGGTRQPGRHS